MFIDEEYENELAKKSEEMFIVEEESSLLTLAFKVVDSKDAAVARIVDIFPIIDTEEGDCDDLVNTLPEEQYLAIIKVALNTLAPNQSVFGSHLLTAEIVSIYPCDEEDNVEFIQSELPTDGAEVLIHISGFTIHIKELTITLVGA